VGDVAKVGKMKNAYKTLVRNPEKKSLRRSRRRREDNMKINLRGI